MYNTNPQKELDKLIERLQSEGKTPSLLLHSCCGPCSSYVLEYLSEYFYITVFYYNPNISPKEEYDFRKEEQKRFIREFPSKNPIDFLDCDYESELFYEKVKGLEQEPEGGARCGACFELRLGRTARESSGRFDYFATTLTISPLKNAELLNIIGRKQSEVYHANYLPTDFKKKNGYLRSTQISKEYNMYRQNFCGCGFSKSKPAKAES